jgi:hypothetical protein
MDDYGFLFDKMAVTDKADLAMLKKIPFSVPFTKSVNVSGKIEI